MKPELLSICKPKLWKVFLAIDFVQFSKLDLNVDGVFEFVNSVVVHSDFKWEVLVNGKQVPETCRFPHVSTIPGPSVITALLKAIDLAVLCPGSPEKEFIQIV